MIFNGKPVLVVHEESKTPTPKSPRLYCPFKKNPTGAPNCIEEKCAMWNGECAALVCYRQRRGICPYSGEVCAANQCGAWKEL